VELVKEDAVTDAEALAVMADGGLDRLSRRVSGALYGGKKVDVTLPAAQPYYGGLAPSEFTKPQLGRQLTSMIAWPALLSKATLPTLLALAPEGGFAVETADRASRSLLLVIADRDLFQNGGERKSVFDDFNALCARAYGDLKAFVLGHPELDLPPGYAESFFQPSASSSTPTTLSAANALVERLEQKLGRARGVQGELSQQAADRAEQEKVHAAALEAVAAARVGEDEARKKKKAATAAAKKAKPKKR
jgi:hypothetical protein